MALDIIRLNVYYMDNPVCPYPVIPLTLTSPIPECFAFFIARSIANLPMAGPFLKKKKKRKSNTRLICHTNNNVVFELFYD